ncbi:MAG: ion transporter [Gemmatimonadaceae bacterium]
MSKSKKPQATVEERYETLSQLDEWLEKPLIYLGLIWVVLLIVELTRGLSPLLAGLGTLIWIIFIVDFIVRMVIAPDRWRYLRRNWLTAISLLMPALRIFRAVRIFRLASVTRGSSLVRVVGRLNRGMSALGSALGRRGFGYVIATSLLVTFGGAAAMYTFEHTVPGTTITGYWTAVWWTAMVMTTMGSDYFPRTMQGRVLCVMLALYAFAIFGYVTATLATFFIGSDAANPQSDIADQKSIEGLRSDIQALRDEVHAMASAGR